MNLQNFYRLEGSEEWLEISHKIDSWLNQIFPSSQMTARMIDVEGPQTLPSGETFTKVALVHLMDSQSGRVIRGVSFIFANGNSRQDLCDASASIFLDATGEITHIEQGLYSEISTQEWREHFEHAYSDTRLTEPWKFASTLELLRGILTPMMKLSSVKIDQDHPLLNRHAVSRVTLRNAPGEEELFSRN